jgi:hypothetical protein
MCTFTLESTHFILNKCPIYTQDGASAKFITNSQETDYSVGSPGNKELRKKHEETQNPDEKGIHREN